MITSENSVINIIDKKNMSGLWSKGKAVYIIHRQQKVAGGTRIWPDENKLVGLAGIFKDFLFESKTKKLCYFKVFFFLLFAYSLTGQAIQKSRINN